ncbi:MAG: Crp/Fnr family transcriptional regulator [Elusimicrobium sp.]|jgi:CRP-like cAMP-binding protein|nr:Crp/Fnr family transcriptional regulator [Elusimicrobium sp.]
MTDIYNELKKSVLFDGLTTAEIERCLSLVRHRVCSFKNNDMVFMSDASFFKEFAVILKGSVFVILSNIDGDAKMLHDLNEGDSFGETAAFRNAMPRDYYVISAGSSKILFINAQQLFFNPDPQIADIHKKIMINTAKMLLKKFMRANYRIMHMTKKTVRDKIISFLREEIGTPRSFTLNGKINKTQLAEFINVDRTALAKELTAMQRDGLLTYNRNSITLKKQTAK